jgi:hypothetical protein
VKDRPSPKGEGVSSAFGTVNTSIRVDPRTQRHIFFTAPTSRLHRRPKERCSPGALKRRERRQGNWGIHQDCRNWERHSRLVRRSRDHSQVRRHSSRGHCCLPPIRSALARVAGWPCRNLQPSRSPRAIPPWSCPLFLGMRAKFSPAPTASWIMCNCYIMPHFSYVSRWGQK